MSSARRQSPSLAPRWDGDRILAVSHSSFLLGWQRLGGCADTARQGRNIPRHSSARSQPKPAPRGCREQNRHEPQDTAEHFPPPGTELTKGTRCLRSEENSPGAPGESRRRQDGLQAPGRDSPAAPGDTGLEQGRTRLKRSGREEQLRAEHHLGTACPSVQLRAEHHLG